MNEEKRFGYGERQYFDMGNESDGASSYFSDNAPATLGVFTHDRWFDPSYGSRAVADQGTADSTLVRTMLAHLRSERPLAEPIVLPGGVTDLRLYRVFVDSATIGIHLQR